MKRKSASLICFLVFIAFFISFLPSAHAETNHYYFFYGPYYEDGTVATGTNITLTMVSSIGNTTYLNLAYPINETVTLNSSRLLSVSWNASSALNLTRHIDFLPTENNVSINLYVTNPSLPSGNYEINLIDMYGMNNSYLQIGVYNAVDSVQTEFIVERHNLNRSSTLLYALTQYTTYLLSVICDQGTYTQWFTAGSEFELNIPIFAGMFPQTTSTLYPTVSADRMNSTLIIITYSDSQNITDWLFLNITHQSGTSTIYDYNSNTTGSSQIIFWNYADQEKTYTAIINASLNGVPYSWIIPIMPAQSDNIWYGILDFLGSNVNTLPDTYTGWPNNMNSAQIAQLIAAAIITVFLGIGSFRNAGASCIMAWIIGGIMFAIGWWNGGLAQAAWSAIPEFGLAGFVAIIIAIHEGKTSGGGLS